MSSIKRDVKKKILPRPEARVFLEIQPTDCRRPRFCPRGFALVCLPFLRFHLLVVTTPIGS